MLRAACERAGVESSEDGEIAVHIITAERFKPIPGRFNILYSMYECTTLPEEWVPPLQTADLIVVPCRQNRDLFKNYTKVPVEVCWEGVDTEVYKYVQRIEPLMGAFVFLWIGAPNPRKGFEHVGSAWDEWRMRPDFPRNAILYVKTTGLPKGEFVEKLTKGMQTFVDTRNLSNEELFGLYEKAHAFLLPSMGEGFGLTLAEAMSTGLPCIYTPWGGPRDFCSEREGYPVKWKFHDVRTVRFDEVGKRHLANHSQAAHADVRDIIRRMEQIYHGYPAALERGRRAAERIRAGFTWDHSAASFISILNRYTEKGVPSVALDAQR
jgi:hypothetical protein